MSLLLKFVLLGIVFGSVVEGEDGKTLLKDTTSSIIYNILTIRGCVGNIFYHFLLILNIQFGDKAPTCETNEDCPKGRVCRVGHCFKGTLNFNYCVKMTDFL